MKKYLLGSVLFASVLVAYAQVKPGKDKASDEGKTEKVDIPRPPAPPAPPQPPLPPEPVDLDAPPPPPAPEAPLPPSPINQFDGESDNAAPPPPPAPAPPMPKKRVIHL